MTAPTVDVAALLAENARLRAIVDRVEALAASARLHPSTAPANGTLAVAEYEGGWQDLPARTRVYVRADGPDTTDFSPYFPGGGDWHGQYPDVGDRPVTWGEVNALDDPECDRAAVSIDTYVSMDALDAALGGGEVSSPRPDVVESYGSGCRCACLGAGTPEHAPSSLCLSTEVDAHANS